MTWFTVETRYISDRDRLAATRPRHRDYLRELVTKGKVMAGGPWADDSAGFAIYRVADAAELDRLLEADPYTLDGIAEHRTVHEWNVTIGAWAELD